MKAMPGLPIALLIGWTAFVSGAGAVTSKVHTFQIETEPTYTYETKYFEQKVDHFSFTNEDATFKQKYLINDTWWKTNNGPIFFYTGNEGTIEAFAQNSGFVWDIAPEFGAMVVFAEHRYYGTSLPFGPDSLKPDPAKNGYLTSEQALADYAELVTYLKSNIKGAARSPVIAFGGSYGGMLAAWFRIKFPHICDGAIAASAPVAQFDTPCDAFNRIVTADYTAASENCSSIIRQSWKAIDEVAVDDVGKKWISDSFGLCNPMTTAQNVTDLKAYLTDLYVNIAMMDYPYPTSFLAPLPGFPVKEVCSRLVEAGVIDEDNNEDSNSTVVPLTKNQTIIRQVVAGASVFYNFTGQAKCLDLSHTDDIGADMWDYQACTEMVMPVCSDGVNDMFEASTWNLTEYAEGCMARWNVTPRENMADIMYGQKKLQGASNIVFSNGLLDPWSSGGILKDINPSVVALLIPEGAHHLDLRGRNIADPQSVFMVRRDEKENIARWIAQAYKAGEAKLINRQRGPSLKNFLPIIRK